MSGLQKDMMCEAASPLHRDGDLVISCPINADTFENKRPTTNNCAGTTGKIRVCGHPLREKNWGKSKNISWGLGIWRAQR